jgi:hypothetical protein
MYSSSLSFHFRRIEFSALHGRQYGYFPHFAAAVLANDEIGFWIPHFLQTIAEGAFA